MFVTSYILFRCVCVYIHTHIYILEQIIQVLLLILKAILLNIFSSQAEIKKTLVAQNYCYLVCAAVTSISEKISCTDF